MGRDIQLQRTNFKTYEKQFKALADEKRLHLLSILHRDGASCVCDLMEKLELPQSKLSYHLKIMMDAEMLLLEKRGTWNYYSISYAALDNLLSEELTEKIYAESNK